MRAFLLRLVVNDQEKKESAATTKEKEKKKGNILSIFSEEENPASAGIFLPRFFLLLLLLCSSAESQKCVSSISDKLLCFLSTRKETFPLGYIFEVKRAAGKRVGQPDAKGGKTSRTQFFLRSNCSERTLNGSVGCIALLLTSVSDPIDIYLCSEVFSSRLIELEVTRVLI